MSELHITDMRTFCQCRRKWDFTSIMRRGLQPVYLSPPLFLGQCVHRALEVGYQGNIGGSMLFNHGLALKEVDDWVGSRVRLAQDRVGYIENQGQIDDLHILATAMIKHYGLWVHSRAIDNRIVLLGTEHKFNIPIPDTDMTYAGRFDGFIETNRGVYILEFKTARSLKDMSGVFRDMQSAAYVWAARQIRERVLGIVYRVLRKRIPDDPIRLKNGSWSMKQDQVTSPEWVKQWPNTAALAAMLDPDQFFFQRLIHRNDEQVANAARALQVLGAEMSHDPTIFAWGGYHCNWCDFRAPCDLINQGYDPTPWLAANTAKRGYWDEETEEEV